MSLSKLKPFLKPTLNEEFRQVINLVCEGIAEFRSYSADRIAVSITTSRSRGRYGVWAHVIPLKYVGGKSERRGQRRGVPGVYAYESVKIQELHPEANYLMTFLVPRFFALSPMERLETIVHEIYHIHPTQRGDLRRFAHPHLHHGPTPALFTRKVKSLTAEALREIPSLLEHPLIAGDGSQYESRVRLKWPRPRHVFKPLWPGVLKTPVVQPAPPLKPQMTWPLLILAAALWLFASMANAMTVKTSRQGSIYTKPSLRSQVLGAYSENTRFEALRLSTQRTWVEVKGLGLQGWVPRAWVEVVGGNQNAQNEAVDPTGVPGSGSIDATPGAGTGEEAFGEAAKEPDDGLGQELKQYDKQSDRYFAVRPGRLFEKAAPMSARYGLIEKDDELKLLSLSSDKAWSQVRLVLTGEEGWYPSKWIRRSREERVISTAANVIEGEFAIGTEGHSLGLNLGYFREILRGGLAKRPRDRLEVGGIFNYWLGSTIPATASSTLTASDSFLQLGVLGRYLLSSDDGKMSGGVEFGFDIHHTNITYSGATSSLAASAFSSNPGNTLGILLGGVGLYSLSPTWQLSVAARAHVSSDSFAYVAFGTMFRF